MLGIAAAVCSTASFAPQAWRVIRTRDTEAISKRMYLITVIGFALWTAYGATLRQWPLIVPNAICLGLSAFILAMKILPRRQVEQVAETLGVEPEREAAGPGDGGRLSPCPPSSPRAGRPAGDRAWR
ncbi:SemiSWEET family sugar transporter [Enterovirga aerilata]|nr:SemiSWEET transporter [Enterovirga sp. DB1703]